MRDNAHTLSDFRTPTLSIECEPCGRRGRYNVARLMEKYGDMKIARAAARARQLPEGEVVQHPRPVQGQVRRRQPALMICARLSALAGAVSSSAVDEKKLPVSGFSVGRWSSKKPIMPFPRCPLLVAALFLLCIRLSWR